jgi:hypothetical protein
LILDDKVRTSPCAIMPYDDALTFIFKKSVCFFISRVAVDSPSLIKNSYFLIHLW